MAMALKKTKGNLKDFRNFPEGTKDTMWLMNQKAGDTFWGRGEG